MPRTEVNTIKGSVAPYLFAMTIKPSSDGFATVDTSHVMFDAKEVPPPLNVQIICGNIHSGKSVLSIWNASHGFTHWAGVPVFPKTKRESQ